MMKSRTHALLYRLAEVAPEPVSDGEVGVRWRDTTGVERSCMPVLSAYLDWRPEITAGRPAERAALIALDERVRQIEKTLLPRGAALDGMRSDVERVKHYLTSPAPSSRGIAIFASSAHRLFETLEVSTPFETQISVGAQPDLFQLARLISRQETAIVAVVDMHSARLFVTFRHALHEVEDRRDDPKLFHLVRREKPMNEAHYQRHAGAVRERFAREVAVQIERLVERYQAAEVILAGHTSGMALLRKALAPKIGQMVHEPLLAMDVSLSPDVIADEIAPSLLVLKADQQRSSVERLVDAIRGSGLGVAGLESTERALKAGQAESLVLAENAMLPPERRSDLIRLATLSDASVDVIKGSDVLLNLGSVGALLRYR